MDIGRKNWICEPITISVIISYVFFHTSLGRGMNSSLIFHVRGLNPFFSLPVYVLNSKITNNRIEGNLLISKCGKRLLYFFQEFMENSQIIKIKFFRKFVGDSQTMKKISEMTRSPTSTYDWNKMNFRLMIIEIVILYISIVGKH